MPSSNRSPLAMGYSYALLAFMVWGFGPLYFRLLSAIPIFDVLAQRILWTQFALLLIVGLSGRARIVFALLQQPRRLATLALSGLLIGINWGVWLWAVNSGHILDSSLGYFILPLVNIALGVLVLKETLTPRQGVAVGIAALGVFGLILSDGHFPWIALSLALSFGLYGLLRKQMPIDPMVGLLFETALCFFPALAWLLWRMSVDARGFSILFPSPSLSALSIGSSIVTIVPLASFVAAAQRLPYATIGILQYIVPSFHLLLGAALYRENFTQGHAIAFGCIWLSLALYTVELRRQARNPNIVRNP